ncbi:MAG TPA: cation:proton antiporter [Steroidobacteraceae bacterium]|nr:cation:proton antiporter [Steroidobacteraceae bacterium]
MSHSPLLLQIVVIVSTARLLAFLLRYLGQSPVVGEMAAGIVLGPIVFGYFAPEWHARLFDVESLGALRGLSEVGLVLFMFIVGAELRMPTGARQQLAAATWIGVLSVLLPMAVGLGLATGLYSSLAPEGVEFWPFALFIASAVSITAFPVMARILKERHMTQTAVGRLSLASAAIADLLAWLLLAVVVIVAGSQQNWTRLGRTVLGIAALALVIFVLCKPLIRRMLSQHAADGRPAGALLAVMLIGTFSCAYVTDILGVHSVFGAFLFGLCLPRDDRLLASLVERIEYVAIIVLMPIFFALAGLNTTADAFVGTGLGAMSAIIVAAVTAKIAAGTVGARIGGQSWRASLAVGSLMNARGMMELIVIKVGLDIGVISHQLFTMLMVMAILTTVMTGPLLTLFSGKANTVAASHTKVID